MKKTLLFIATLLCMSQSMMAIKPLLTEGYDKYNNSFKVDLVSVAYMSPQIVWEHYTNTRFSYGVSAQVHFVNRSSAVAVFDKEDQPATARIDGKTRNVNWQSKDHPLDWYAEVGIDGKTYDIEWDRKYVGVMLCPEGRYYFGRKPDRGFYGVARVDVGLFREMFDIFVTTLDKEYISGLTSDQKKTDARYQEYLDDKWRKAGVRQGETFMAIGCGFGLGYQGWFGKNSHWGFDLNVFGKSDWKFSEDDNVWEWFWGVGLPGDWNASIIYRF